MDPQNLIQTAQLFSGSPLLLKEVIDKLIEHDKWKTLATFQHEIELENIRSSRQVPNRYREKETFKNNDFSEEEIKFNSLTSYGSCNEKHLGLIAKTKIWEGSHKKSQEILDRWIKYIEDNHIVAVKDLKGTRIRSLLLLFLWASGCSYRMNMWPDASDKELVDNLKGELKSKFSKFSKVSIVSAYEGLKKFWKEINNNEDYPFNCCLISDILDEAYEYVNKKTQLDFNLDIKNSPLFREFEKEFSNVELETLEKYFIKQRKNFVAAGVGAIRKVFTTQVPEEFEEEYSSSEWPKKWHQYVSQYEPKWRDKLEEILTRTKEEQKAWENNPV